MRSVIALLALRALAAAELSLEIEVRAIGRADSFYTTELRFNASDAAPALAAAFAAEHGLPSAHRDALEARVRDALSRAWAPDPSSRPDAADFSDGLAEALVAVRFGE